MLAFSRVAKPHQGGRVLRTDFCILVITAQVKQQVDILIKMNKLFKIFIVHLPAVYFGEYCALPPVMEGKVQGSFIFIHVPFWNKISQKMSSDWTDARELL